MRNKRLSYMIAFTMIITLLITNTAMVFVDAANWQDYYDFDFENGVLPDSFTATKNNLDAIQLNVVDDGSGFNKAIKVYADNRTTNTANNAGFMQFATPLCPMTFEMSGRFMIPDISKGRLTFAMSAASTQTIVRIDQNGGYFWAQTAIGSFTSPANVVSGKYYSYKFKVDIANSTVDIYWDGVYLGRRITKLATDKAPTGFRLTNDILNSGTTTGYEYSVYHDDFYLSDPALVSIKGTGTIYKPLAGKDSLNSYIATSTTPLQGETFTWSLKRNLSGVKVTTNGDLIVAGSTSSKRADLIVTRNDGAKARMIIALNNCVTINFNDYATGTMPSGTLSNGVSWGSAVNTAYNGSPVVVADGSGNKYLSARAARANWAGGSWLALGFPYAAVGTLTAEYKTRYTAPLSTTDQLFSMALTEGTGGSGRQKLMVWSDYRTGDVNRWYGSSNSASGSYAVTGTQFYTLPYISTSFVSIKQVMNFNTGFYSLSTNGIPLIDEVTKDVVMSMNNAFPGGVAQFAFGSDTDDIIIYSGKLIDVSDTSLAPVVSGVTMLGDFMKDAYLTPSYTFTGGMEGDSVYEWETAADIGFTSNITTVATGIVSATTLDGAKYKVGFNDEGRYIRFKIVPKMAGFSADFPSKAFYSEPQLIRNESIQFSYTSGGTQGIENFVRGELVVNSTVSLNEVTPVMLAVAQYEGNRLIKINASKQEGNKTYALTCSLNIEQAAGTKVKIFHWYGDGYLPLYRVIELAPAVAGIETNFYPGWTKKAVTFSYDDGTRFDNQLVEIFNQNNVKGTFNLNAKNYVGYTEQQKLDLAALYNGHEVANHTDNHYLMSLDASTSVPFRNETLTTEQCQAEILNGKTKLEGVFNTPDYPATVRGFAWPFNDPDRTELYEYMSSIGIAYARPTRTTTVQDRYSIPTNWLDWRNTCHHSALQTIGPEFLALDTQGEMKLLAVWGHSYEFAMDYSMPVGQQEINKWYIIDDFAKLIKDDTTIWKATNINVHDYIEAQKLLQVEETKVINPSNMDLYIKINGNKITVKAGETYFLD